MARELFFNLIRIPSMLILTRHPGERIFIGDDIQLRVINVDHNVIQMGLEATPQVQAQVQALPSVQPRRERDESLDGQRNASRKGPCALEPRP